MIHYSKLFISVLHKDPLLRKSLQRNTVYLFKKILRVYFGRKYGKIIIVNLTEHIGDIVACEPISYHLRKLHPRAFIIWSLNEHYRELVDFNTNVNAVLPLTCLTEWIFLNKIFWPFVKIYDLHINGKRCTVHRICSRNSVNSGINFTNYLNYGNLLQISAKAAGIRNIPDYAPKFHFKHRHHKSMINHKYIVLHTLSNENERNWSGQKWNELVKLILVKYPSYHIAEIGLENIIESGSDRYHNLTGKLNLQEIAHLINDSALFIGVESGFAHVANSLSKNSIIMIGYFNEFKNYMVYSGTFAKGENVSLLYYPGLLEKMDLERVIDEVDSRINTLQSVAL